MRYFIFIMTILLLGTASCKKHDGNELHNGYFVFGRAYGECGGPNCAQLYKIQNGRVYADNMDYYTEANVFTFGTVALAQSKYALALQAYNSFPGYMTINPDTTWGCPDCHDQGGFHFAMSNNGTTSYWHVDTDTARQPQAIRSYMVLVNDLLNQLAD